MWSEAWEHRCSSVTAATVIPPSCDSYIWTTAVAINLSRVTLHKLLDLVSSYWGQDSHEELGKKKSCIAEICWNEQTSEIYKSKTFSHLTVDKISRGKSVKERKLKREEKGSWVHPRNKHPERVKERFFSKMHFVVYKAMERYQSRTGSRREHRRIATALLRIMTIWKAACTVMYMQYEWRTGVSTQAERMYPLLKGEGTCTYRQRSAHIWEVKANTRTEALVNPLVSRSSYITEMLRVRCLMYIINSLRLAVHRIGKEMFYQKGLWLL